MLELDLHHKARQDFGLYIKVRRNELGHSSKAVASFLDISENTLERIESGKFDFDFKLLLRICDTLELQPYFVPIDRTEEFDKAFK